MNRKDMTMKTTLRTILCTAAFLLACAWPAHAQRVLTTTTLSANQTAAADTMSVTSSTGFTVGQLVLVDWEVERITSLNGVAGTSTLINVQRGVDGNGRRPGLPPGRGAPGSPDRRCWGW